MGDKSRLMSFAHKYFKIQKKRVKSKIMTDLIRIAGFMSTERALCEISPSLILLVSYLFISEITNDVIIHSFDRILNFSARIAYLLYNIFILCVGDLPLNLNAMT